MPIGLDRVPVELHPEYHCFACGKHYGPDPKTASHDDDCPVIATALRRLKAFSASRSAGLHPLETDARV